MKVGFCIRTMAQVIALDYYRGIFTLAALERITGINQTQPGHYAAGRSKPRKQQIQKLEKALHHPGQELCTISF
ncbi:MAG: helix-turn-helix transcriptional regulator [Mariniphaga sp.]